MTEPTRWPACGEVFEGRYRLDVVLGEGGHGIVFGALQVDAARHVAIKVLKPDPGGNYPPERIARFEREVRIIAGLRDPATVTLFTHGTSVQGLLYMVFELVSGEDLGTLLDRAGPVGSQETIHVLRQILGALAEAHAAGLLHRDIKPQNIRIYTYANDRWRAKLLDFGIARPTNREGDLSITRTGELVGTPRYMSPEQLLDGDLSAASDLYSLGLVGFDMLTGRQTLHGPDMAQQFARLRAVHVFDLPEMDFADPRLREVLAGLTAREPRDRFQSAAEVIEALDRIGAPIDRPRSGSTAEQPAAIGDTTESGSPAARGRWAIPAVSIAAMAAIAVIAGLAMVIAEPDAPLPVPAPRTSSAAPPSFVRSAQPVPREQPEVAPPDAGRPDVQVAPGAPGSGCGREIAGRGVVTLSKRVGLSTQDWHVYIPQGYDPAAEHPLIVLFHHETADAVEFVSASGFDALADDKGFLVLMPQAPAELNPMIEWGARKHVKHIDALLEDTMAELCVNQRRIYLVGQALGGSAVDHLSCRRWVAGIATHAYRADREDGFSCNPAAPVPYLHLAPTKTQHLPVDGGADCRFSTVISLARTEQLWAQRNECKKKYASKRKVADATCYVWNCRNAPFESCHLDSGYQWPGDGVARADPLSCNGPTGEFPAAREIWDFFERSWQARSTR